MSETWNKFGVGIRGKRLVMMVSPIGITPDDALLLAAWLVAVAEPFASVQFDPLLEKIRS